MLCELPLELLEWTLSYLSIADLISIQQVNKQLNSLLQTEISLWKEAFLLEWDPPQRRTEVQDGKFFWKNVCIERNHFLMNIQRGYYEKKESEELLNICEEYSLFYFLNLV